MNDDLLAKWIIEEVRKQYGFAEAMLHNKDNRHCADLCSIRAESSAADVFRTWILNHVEWAIGCSLGVYRIGNGSYYARVYAHPYDETKVIKICNDAMQDGYTQYAYGCLIGYFTGANAPVIHGMWMWENFCIIIMERLVELNMFHDRDNEAYIDLNRAVTAAITERSENSKCNFEFINRVVQYSRDNNINLDIHGRNVMKRMDGTIVLTDPYAGADDVYTMLNLEQKLAA